MWHVEGVRKETEERESGRGVSERRAQLPVGTSRRLQNVFQSCPPEKQRGWVIYTPTPFTFCLRAKYINTLAIAFVSRYELNVYLLEKVSRCRFLGVGRKSHRSEERSLVSE